MYTQSNYPITFYKLPTLKHCPPIGKQNDLDCDKNMRMIIIIYFERVAIFGINRELIDETSQLYFLSCGAKSVRKIHFFKDRLRFLTKSTYIYAKFDYDFANTNA